MTHIMQEDARRRFVIAFTIENTQMRFWLASRSEVLVSLPYNWITVRHTFLHQPFSAYHVYTRTTDAPRSFSSA